MQPAQRFEVTGPGVTLSSAGRLARLPFRRLLARCAGVAVPALLALLILNYLVPSRLEGLRGGLTGALAWLGDRQPLLLTVALFLAVSEAGRYWIDRYREVRGVSAVAEPHQSPVRSVRRLALPLLGVALLAYGLRSTVVAAFRVVGPSMLPTLESGDFVLVNRLAYGMIVPLSKRRLGKRFPRRGDLVVFRATGLTGSDGPQSAVKRVIGLPGDEVAFNYGKITINGWSVPACDAGPYVGLSGAQIVRGRLTVEFLDDRAFLTVRDIFQRPLDGYLVKPGEVFVLGDDRGMSKDSRSWNDRGAAGVPVDILEGRVSRVLVGARPDGRLDLGRFASAPLGLEVRLPGIDMRLTDERIKECLASRPANTWAPPPRAQSARQ